MFVKKGMPKAPGSGRKKGTPNKKPPMDALGIVLPHDGDPLKRGRPMGPSKSTEEYYREVVAVATGDSAARVEVRDGMLEAFEYFIEEARSYRRMAQWVRDKIIECKTPDDFAAVDLQLDAVTTRVQNFYLLAADVGQKVLPYVHARLSAMVVAGSNDGPIESIGLLLQEIDQLNRGRPTWAPPEMKLVSNG